MKNIMKSKNLFILLILTPLLALPQSGKDFSIKGRLDGLQNNEQVKLEISGQGGVRQEVGMTVVKNGEFYFEGNVPDGPRYFFIYLRYFPQDKLWEKSIPVLIDSGDHLIIQGVYDRKLPTNLLPYITIEGGETASAWQRTVSAYLLFRLSIDNIDRDLQQIKDSIGYDRKLVEGYIKSKEEIYAGFLTGLNHKFDAFNRSLPLFLYFNRNYVNHASLVTNVYQRLNDHDKKSFYGKLLKEDSSLAVGQSFPLFTLSTPEGQLLKLEEVIKKSKLTIVHFWSTQSQDVEKMQQELIHYNDVYHSKGLNIVGVYMDKYGEQWKDDLKEKHLPWYQVSDLKGKEGIVETTYHSWYASDNKGQATTNILIDKNGKILAWNVSGIELQYYLDKFLSGDE
jgi:peroxiredoxin